MKTKYVYVAMSGVTSNPPLDLRMAVETATELVKAGHCVYVPQLNFMWEAIYPQSKYVWTTHSLRWLSKCDAIVKVMASGPFQGMIQEEMAAKNLKIPVFDSTLEFFKWAGEKDD